MKKANIIISIVLIIFSCFYAFLTTNLPARNLPNTLGSDFMPWLLVICLFFLSALLLFKSLFMVTLEKFDYKISMKEGSGIIFLTILVFLYVKAMSMFGFILLTPIFVAVLMFISGSRKWKEVVIVAVVVTFGIYFFFSKVFRIPLPGGNIF
ncbi:MAG: tripartite tricarboxylate transporter TctB family protein [Deltaproteobacteria bacterium]|nr:tripartite tricarboxylate transporter TctB family protein [Deltaproteobacteria bacterium]